VLEVVMDLVFEHVKADRGIILLVDAKTDEVTPKVVRLRDTMKPQGQRRDAGGREGGARREDPQRRARHQSRVSQGEAVLSSNAMTDKLFSKSKSVHAMSIRSALCVPIKARKLDGKGGDEVLGVIYIDSSAKNHTYVPDQLRLLTAIGLQAGMAIQNAQALSGRPRSERLAAIGERPRRCRTRSRTSSRRCAAVRMWSRWG